MYIQALKKAEFWLLGTAASLIAIHLTLLSRANDASLLGTSTLFWVAVCSLLWSKLNVLRLNSGLFSSLLGASLIGLVLLKSALISGYDPFLRILPVISGLGVALLSSGFKDLKQYWQELLILCFIAPSPGAIALMLDISTLTARFAAALLWCLGFEVSCRGVYVILPTGGIQVYPGCSGIESMLQMLGLAVLFLIMFPTDRSKKVFAPLIAVFIAFTVNALRIALLTVLASPSSQKAFNYWHKGDGSLIFSMASVLIFGIVCLFLIQKNDSSVEC